MNSNAEETSSQANVVSAATEKVSASAHTVAGTAEDISTRIQLIQDDSKNEVEAITKISQVINQINDLSNSISLTIEEQTATTNEIGRSISEV
jgi:methyl-accepting chemotaxis protein